MYSIKFDFIMFKHVCCYNLEILLHVGPLWVLLLTSAILKQNKKCFC